MRAAQEEQLLLLKKEGRVVLPIKKREKHFEVHSRDGLPKDNEKEEHKNFFNCSVDLFKVDKKSGEEICIQRRFYDKDGQAEQDVDYVHPNTMGNHVFPHVHLWLYDESVGSRVRCKDFIQVPK